MGRENTTIYYCNSLVLLGSVVCLGAGSARRNSGDPYGDDVQEGEALWYANERLVGPSLPPEDSGVVEKVPHLRWGLQRSTDRGCSVTAM